MAEPQEMLRRHIRMDYDECPHCGQWMDKVSPGQDPDDIPEPGDFTVCLYCVKVGVYDADMKVQKAGLIPPDMREVLKQHQAKVRAFQKTKLFKEKYAP